MSIIKIPSYILDSTMDFTFNNVTATGNLVSVNANLGNAATANYFTGTLTTAAQPNITSVGTLTSLTVTNDVTVGGNLTVNGTTTTVNSTTVSVNDINIVLANNASSAVLANGAGITINGANANFLYNSTSNSFTFSHPITANGSLLTNITGANVSGQVSNSLVSSTVYTNAQPNITSVGTLTSITVSGTSTLGAVGNVKITGGSADYVLKTDGTGNLSWVAPASGGGGSSTLSGLTDVTIATPTSGQTLVYDSSSSKWLNSTITATAPLVMSDDVFAGDGSTTTYNLSVTPTSTLYTVVAIGGVVQPRSYYSLSGNVLTFSTAPPISPISITTFGGNATLIGKAITVTSNAQPNITSVGTLTSLSVTGTTTSGFFAGNGSSLTSLTGANVTGAVAYAAIANAVAGGNVSGAVTYATTANSVAGANVSGTVANATYATSAESATTAGTVTTAAQPNITSTGTLTTLSVSGNVSIGGWATLQQSSEVLTTKTGATGVVAHDMTTGATFYHTSPAANFTANFTNVSTTDSRAIVAALVIVQGSTPYVPTAVQIDGTAQTIKWIGSTAPTGTASKTDVVSFTLMRVSAAWSVYGQYSSYG